MANRKQELLNGLHMAEIASAAIVRTPTIDNVFTWEDDETLITPAVIDHLLMLVLHVDSEKNPQADEINTQVFKADEKGEALEPEVKVLKENATYVLRYRGII